MERAIYGTKEGDLIVGYGPFHSQATPPPSGVAFYRNDFSLSASEPWLLPDRVEVIERSQEVTSPAPQLQWEAPESGAFSEVFREVSTAIQRGLLQKSVPVVTETGSGEVDPEVFLDRLRATPETLRPYGWIGEERGFLGATPETLFRYYDGRIYTMALAGTARSDELAIFAQDDKEIREHEFVAQTLIEKLSTLGMVKRRERDIVDLGQLIHFRTLIEVELYKHEGIDSLVRHLHPTPALGPLPRTSKTLAQLQEWRTRLNCPGAFGAPFGLLRDGEFEALVAIRMIAWEKDRYFLPSGCGVIAESRLVNEWRELTLKRESVRRVLCS
jgi:menaquinone-specific isochorismate synthase